MENSVKGESEWRGTEVKKINLHLKTKKKLNNFIVKFKIKIPKSEAIALKFRSNLPKNFHMTF